MQRCYAINPTVIRSCTCVHNFYTKTLLTFSFNWWGENRNCLGPNTDSTEGESLFIRLSLDTVFSHFSPVHTYTSHFFLWSCLISSYIHWSPKLSLSIRYYDRHAVWISRFHKYCLCYVYKRWFYLIVGERFIDPYIKVTQIIVPYIFLCNNYGNKWKGKQIWKAAILVYLPAQKVVKVGFCVRVLASCELLNQSVAFYKICYSHYGA